MDGRPGSVSDLSLAIRRARRSGDVSFVLASRQLRSLPDDLFRLDKIQVLDLSMNSLSVLDDKVSQLASLQELNLARNQLTEVPAQSLLQLPLVLLQLHGNPLQPPFAKLLPEKRGGDLRHCLEGLAPFKSAPAAGGDIDSSLGQTMSGEGAWRKERQVLLAELEELRKKGGRPSGGASWLTSSPHDLPSSRDAVETAKSADKVAAELRDVQQQNQRLQREVQKLEERIKECGAVDTASTVPTLESLDGVDIQDVIAQGGFARVCFATWLHTRVACKQIVDPVITDALLQDFDTEVSMLSRLRHPSVIQMLAVCRHPPHLAFLTELVEGGTLYDLLWRRGRHEPQLSRDHLRGIAVQVGQAVEYLHHMSVVHRDLKSQNVLLTPSRDAKLCDFGLARMRSDLCTGRMQWAGTPSYMAPELFRKQAYTEKVDVFAFGAMLIEALAGEVPFDGLDGGEIGDKWERGYVPTLSSSLPRELRDLILRCYDSVAAQRPAMAEVVPQLVQVPVD